MLPLPIPPSGTPWEADGLQRSLVNGSIGAFRPCDASSRTYDHSLRPRLIILIASMKVTLNSLRMFAWLLSRLRHACSGGAPPSKSNSCSAVRPTYSSAGHEFFRQWKMWPLTIAPARLRSASCRFSPSPAPVVTAAAPPTRSCPRRAPPIRGARPLGSRQTRRFAGRTPSCASPAATGLPSGSPPHRRAAPADRFGALWIGWSRRGRLDWIGPNPTSEYVWLSLFLLF